LQNPSRIVLGIGLLVVVLAATAGIAYFGLGPVQAQISVSEEDAEDLAPGESRSLAPGSDPISPRDQNPPLTVSPEDNLAPSKPGFGTISGGIRISTKLIDSLKSYKVIVHETVNTNARKPDDPAPFYKYQTFRVDWSKGTPFFDMPQIPFSDHAYRVTVAAEGMNGSSAYINLTSQHPRGKNGPIELALTPGTIYSVILRDQRQNPRAGMTIHLVPTGDSLTKRKRHHGETNNFGNIVFEGVERGDYTLTVGTIGAPSAPPEVVTVHPSAVSFSNGRPKVQGKTVIVPEGKNVTIEVWSRHGIPLDNVNLRAWQLEIQRYYDFKGKTDRAGRTVFENVPYGKYQISVDSPSHGRRDRKFDVVKGPEPALVTIRMPR